MLIEKIARMKESEHYKKLIDSGLYLCNVFFMMDKNNNVSDGFHFGFYDKQKDLMSTLKLLNSIQLISDQEIAKQNYDEIPELNLDEVKLDFESVDKILRQTLFERFPTEVATRKMILLQAGPKYQCSLSCTSGNIITIVISAVTGDVEKVSTFNVRELVHKK